MKTHARVAPLVLGSTLALALAACSGSPKDDAAAASSSAVGTSAIKTVFLIVMENHDWKSIKGNASAPYVNKVLLPMASYATQYRSPSNTHPSEPNYIWLEAGDNLGITNDNDPDDNHQATTDHLVTQLENAGLDWKSYQEDIGGDSCPLTGTPLVSTYAPRHNPMVYFDDVTDGNDAQSAHCISHVRPYTELAGDLASDSVASYNFITPNLCHDMHGGVWSCLFGDLVKAGDDWLSHAIPQIMGSAAYKNGGAIFVTWDESEADNAPIGMIAISPLAKGHGYSNAIPYTHSSTLRTIETIFGLPPLRGASTSNDLRDLFVSFP